MPGCGCSVQPCNVPWHETNIARDSGVDKMAGNKKTRHKPKTRRYVLEWEEGHELHGLEVTMRAMRLGELSKLGAMYDDFKGVEGEDEESPGSRLKLLTVMIEKIAGVLVYWNRMDEDTMGWDEENEEYIETPDTKLLPTTVEGLEKLEDWEFMALLESYFVHAVGVSADLGKGSSSGASSLAELPMTEQ